MGPWAPRRIAVSELTLPLGLFLLLILAFFPEVIWSVSLFFSLGSFLSSLLTQASSLTKVQRIPRYSSDLSLRVCIHLNQHFP